MITLRDYQQETVNAIFNYYLSGNDGNIIAALPTGVGKSLVIGGFIEQTFKHWPDQRFLVMSHVEKILTQDHKATLKLWANAPIGLFSAGLNKKESAMPIVIGGVASIVNAIESLGHRDVCIIDEVHMVSSEEDSMYQKIITGLSEINPNLKIVGLSATPYRNGQGLLTEGPLFDDIVIDLTSIECFNRFIEEGYLAPLIPKQTNIEIDTANIRTVRGDFANNQLDEATEKVIYEALKEAVAQGQDRHSCIVFTSGIKTAEHAAEILQSFGISATAIHSKLKKEECEKRFAAFESGEITAICGNEKFTTGYDFAPVDFCIMLRATKSASKWIQMLGRLTRPYDFNNPQQYIKGFDYVKHNALVLDFAGNCRRLGPINDVQLPHKKGTGSGEVPIKVCESCGAYNHASARFCGGKPYASDEGCGFEFIFKTKLVTQAGTEQLIRGFDNIPVVERFLVDRVIYNRHNKVGSEPSIKVSYWCGLRKFNEYVCLQHKGYAKRKAKLWWQQRSSADVPDTTDEALSFVSTLRCPKAISVRTDLQYPEIISVEW